MGRINVTSPIFVDSNVQRRSCSTPWPMIGRLGGGGVALLALMGCSHDDEHELFVGSSGSRWLFWSALSDDCSDFRYPIKIYA